jgi:CRISPR-associated protein Cas1
VRQSENVLGELARFYHIVPPKVSVNSLDDEGKASVAYFAELAKVFKALGFEFSLRRNAVDSNNSHASTIVNACLNFGYSILEANCRREINSVGLDPSIGFVHSTYHTSEPLVYDSQELFRWLIDLSVVQLLESKPKVGMSDFIRNYDGSIRLDGEVAKRLIDAIKSNFNALVEYRGRPRSYDLRQSLLHTRRKSPNDFS